MFIQVLLRLAFVICQLNALPSALPTLNNYFNETDRWEGKVVSIDIFYDDPINKFQSAKLQLHCTGLMVSLSRFNSKLFGFATTARCCNVQSLSRKVGRSDYLDFFGMINTRYVVEGKLQSFRAVKLEAKIYFGSNKLSVNKQTISIRGDLTNRLITIKKGTFGGLDHDDSNFFFKPNLDVCFIEVKDLSRVALKENNFYPIQNNIEDHLDPAKDACRAVGWTKFGNLVEAEPIVRMNMQLCRDVFLRSGIRLNITSPFPCVEADHIMMIAPGLDKSPLQVTLDIGVPVYCYQVGFREYFLGLSSIGARECHKTSMVALASNTAMYNHLSTISHHRMEQYQH